MNDESALEGNEKLGATAGVAGGEAATPKSAAGYTGKCCVCTEPTKPDWFHHAASDIAGDTVCVDCAGEVFEANGQFGVGA